MKKIVGAVFEDSTVVLDGNEYTACDFKNCKIIYNGGPLPRIVHCNLSRCAWQFGAAAYRTLSLLEMVHGLAGGQSIVEGFFDLIRAGKYINPSGHGSQPPPEDLPPQPNGRHPRRRR